MTSELNYSSVGEGFPVVFLHGFLEDLTMWRHLCALKGIQAICIDLPGHGESMEAVDFSMHSIADKIIHLLDSIEVNEYHIIGHSMGGYIGLEILSKDPRVQKLVLLNSNFWSDTEEKKHNRKRVASVVRRNKHLFLYEAIPNLFFRPEQYDSEIKQLIASAKKIKSSTIAEYSIAMSQRFSFNELVERRQNDILVIQGENDAVVELAVMRKASENLQQLQVVIVPGGHMSYIEAPQICGEWIANFLVR